ncbi:MAG TPA: hypothetical protein VF808_15985 [Ktedonobacterales bacterium]
MSMWFITQACALRQRWAAVAFLLGSLALSACGVNATAQVKPTATAGPVVRVAVTIHLAEPSGGSHPIANGLWFAGGERSLYEVDPATNIIVASVLAPDGAGEYLAAAGSLWVSLDGRIVRLDPTSGRVLATIPLAGVRGDGARMAADATSLWVGVTYGDTLARIDLKTSQLIKVIPIDATPTSVAIADGSVWVCAHHSLHAQPALWRIDPTTYKTLATIDTTEGQGFQCGGVNADANGAIWVGNVQEIQEKHDLLRIDPATNRVVATAAIDGQPSDVAADPNSVWVVDPTRSVVIRYDAQSDQLIGVSAPLTVGGPSNQEVPGHIWEADGALWVQSFTSTNLPYPGPTVWRLQIAG